MVLIGRTETPPKAVKRFEGMVMVLHHASTIQPKYQAMMHCGAIRVISAYSPSMIIAYNPSKLFGYYPSTILRG